LASVKRQGCCTTWRHGLADDCVWSSGDSGNMGATATSNCAVWACLTSERQWRRGAVGCMAHGSACGRPAGTVERLFRVAWLSLTGGATARLTQSNRRVRTRMHVGVGWEEPGGSPLSRSNVPYRFSFAAFATMTNSEWSSVICGRGPLLNFRFPPPPPALRTQRVVSLDYPLRGALEVLRVWNFTGLIRTGTHRVLGWHTRVWI